MAKNIEPSLKKIGDYLKLDVNSDVVFTIPEYQRPYAWEIDRCDKLWQDVNDFMYSGSKDRYFFGTVIISCQENDTKFALIDGQQRTTSFLLLFKALLLRINDAIDQTMPDEDSAQLYSGLKQRRKVIMGILCKEDPDDVPDIPSFEKDKSLCGKTNIVETKSINEPYKNELQTILSSVTFDEAMDRVTKIPRKQKDNKYTNYFKNFKFFYKKVAELSDAELNKIAKTLIENCEVIEIKSWQVEQAINMFNSLNSDGLPLYDADIISAQLYAAADKNNVTEEFNAKWNELLSHIEVLKENDIVEIDSILYQQMYYERAKNLNNEIITPKGTVDVTVPGLRNYYLNINEGLLDDPCGLCDELINLAKIWKKVIEYPIMQVLLRFNANTKLFLASYFHRFKEEEINEDNEENIEGIVTCLLRLFAVLELVDIGYSSSLFKTFLFREIVKLANPKTPLEEIKFDFDKHISEKWNPEDIKKYLIEYDKNALVFLNEYLFAKDHNNIKNFVVDNKRCDIEHVMPSSGKDIGTIRADAGLDSKEEFENFVNKLGNKILLEEKINRSLGNQWFRTKVSSKRSQKTGYIDSQYPLANALVEKYRNDTCKPYWTKDDISLATEKASERIIDFIFDN